ncbi:right-handed parallel beta-helix repeat-containing protein, partial [Candidatus Eisenbacteria bacterium]
VLGYNSDISGLDIHDNQFGGTPGGGYVGVFINHTLEGTGTVTVQDNEFRGDIAQGVFTERDNTDIKVNDLVTGLSGDGIIVMDFGGRAQNQVSITGNTIESFSRGIVVGNSGGQTLTNIDIEHNCIKTNGKGVQVRASASDVVVNGNCISGNVTYGVENTDTGNTLDASGNWWGSNVASTVRSEAHGGVDVDYTPWLDGGSETSPGFDGDFSTLYVDDDSPQTGTTGRIEEGVDLVTGSTVNVNPGTYPEGLVTIDKSLAIIGDAGTRPVVTPTEDTNNATHRGWFQVEGSGTVVDIKNMVFNGSGKLIENCIRYQSGPTGTIENCDISNIYWSKYTGLGVVNVDYTAYGGGSPLDVSPEFYVKDCTFSDIQRIGISIFGIDKGYVQGCTYTGKGDGDWIDYGVEVGGGGSAVIDDGNEIMDCTGVALSDGSVSAGILVTEYFGDPSVAVIDGNDLHDNSGGVHVGYGTTDASTVTVTDNDIYDGDYGVLTSASPGITLTVTGNEIHGNSVTGVHNESSNLVAYSNQFYGNGQNAQDDGTSANQWNHSSCPGNYWDDYVSNSGYSTQYNVSGTAGSIDNCPLSIGVTLDSSTLLMACGETIVYQVNVGGNALDLMGADYKINYDKTKLSFVSATVGDLLDTTPGHIFTYVPNPDATGVLQINSAHLGTGVNGPGTIAEVTFTSIGSTSPSSAALTFSGTELRDSGNQTLPSTWTGASVVIDCVDPTIAVTFTAATTQWPCYNTAPTVHILATDDYDLDCVKYKIDTGSWADVVCGISGTSYLDPSWTLLGFGGLSEGSHTYSFKSTDDAGNESAETSVTFTKDTLPPSAVTDFVATVGHNQIVLDWTNPGSDVYRIYLYRNDWTSYPGYGTADPGYPTVVSYDLKTNVDVLETYTDVFSNTTRGIYAYRAVVYDCAGNYASAGSGDYDRATSYFLGDIASSAGSWGPNYDGVVDGSDYNPFSGCYWTTSPGVPCNEADFGPTIEPVRGNFGIPTPDAYVGFDDLMIFSMNYGNVPPPSPALSPLPGVELASAGMAEASGVYRL